MGDLGCNVAGRGEYAAGDLARAGSRVNRCPLYGDRDISGWLNSMQAAGLTVVLILGSEILGNDESRWKSILQATRARYGGRPNVIFQAGNEPDGRPPSSWVMDQARYQRLWNAVQESFAGERVITAGFCNGDPSWGAGLDLHDGWALAYHPYGKHPTRHDWGTGYLPDCHAGYLAQATARGMRCVITEVGISSDEAGRKAFTERLVSQAPTSTRRARLSKQARIMEMSANEQGAYYGDLAVWMRDRADLAFGLIFCWSDQMVPSFGMLRQDGSMKPSYRAFQNAAPPIPQGPTTTTTPAPPPPPTSTTTTTPPPPPTTTLPPLPYYCGAGVEAVVRKNGYTMLGPEQYPTDDYSITPCVEGQLWYYEQADHVYLVSHTRQQP